MKKTKSEAELRNLQQTVSVIPIIISLFLVMFLYQVYKGRVKFFYLDIPTLRLFALSLCGIAEFMFFYGVYLFTTRRLFLLLSFIGILWFVFMFIKIDMM